LVSELLQFLRRHGWVGRISEEAGEKFQGLLRTSTTFTAMVGKEHHHRSALGLSLGSTNHVLDDARLRPEIEALEVAWLDHAEKNIRPLWEDSADMLASRTELKASGGGIYAEGFAEDEDTNFFLYFSQDVLDEAEERSLRDDEERMRYEPDQSDDDDDDDDGGDDPGDRAPR
jgi:hypothetical protein